MVVFSAMLRRPEATNCETNAPQGIYCTFVTFCIRVWHLLLIDRPHIQMESLEEDGLIFSSSGYRGYCW